MFAARALCRCRSFYSKTHFAALKRPRSFHLIQRRLLSTEAAAVDEIPTESNNSGKTWKKRRTVIPTSKGNISTRYNCSGCGAVLQSINPTKRGFIPKDKLGQWFNLVDDPKVAMLKENEHESGIVEGSTTTSNEDNDEFNEDIEDYFPETSVEGNDVESSVSSLICKRCFSLKYYNSALSITLAEEDYLKHVQTIKTKRALLVLILDVTDFPSCIFPNLKDLISPSSSVLVVANKIDLFPPGLKTQFWVKFRDYIIQECINSGLTKSAIVGLRFISVKQGKGVHKLSEEIVKKWGNRGDVYLLGCTNVGKSSLFNKFLGHLCGSRPGELNMDSNLVTPKATISNWPGTTLGLLSFPLMSIGKRRRLQARQKAREEKISLGFLDPGEEYVGGEDAFQSFVENEDMGRERRVGNEEELLPVDAEDVLDRYDLRKKKVTNAGGYEPPKNKFWLHDTPGAINEAQLINHLTTQELTMGLPKKPFKPQTFILKPGQCIFVGGLARLDYVEGPVSAYFTFFTWAFLNIHATKIRNADTVYERQLGSPESIFKLPFDNESRRKAFPKLEGEVVEVSGAGWKESALDVVLSSAGWVAVTVGEGNNLTLKAYTPLGKGIHVRKPALLPEAVNERGKRERYGTRTAYRDVPRRR